MKIVNLTFRSALIGCFHCSSTCRREQVRKNRNSGELYEHKIPIKIEWEGDTNNTAKESWCTYSYLRVVEVIVLIKYVDHLMRQIVISDGWIGRNIIKLDSELECNDPKHWTAIYVLPIQRWDVKPQPFQGQEVQGGTRRTLLGSILRRTTLHCSRFLAWAESKKHLAVAARTWMVVSAVQGCDACKMLSLQSTKRRFHSFNPQVYCTLIHIGTYQYILVHTGT